MNEERNKMMLHFAECLQREINAMLNDNDETELEGDYLFARLNLKRIYTMRRNDLMPERTEHG